jgi:fructose-bisphosphate aldolase class II
MVRYQDLGLSNTREMFKKAMAGGYAIPAYNFNNLEQLQAIIQGCIQSRSPVILQISKGARQYANQTLLRYMAEGAMKVVKESGVLIPVALHLDHGDTYELCVSCIESGFSSVMIDGSAHPYAENVALTRKVVEFAHQHDVTVEGELGVLAGIEDEVSHKSSNYTNPDDVEDFVKKTGVDSLAISIGTSHGAFKFKVKPGEEPPPLRSTSWRRSSVASRDSPSSCTGPAPCSPSTWPSSTSSAARWKGPWGFPRSSFAGPPNPRSARSTSTPTGGWWSRP